MKVTHKKTLENVQKWLFFTQILIKNMFKELKIEKKIVGTSFPLFLDNLGQFSQIKKNFTCTDYPFRPLMSTEMTIFFLISKNL